VQEKLNGILKTGAAKTKKLRSQAKCALDEDARDQLMRQSQQYQIVRDCRILLKFGELARHPEIRRADVTREEGHPDIKMEEGIGRQESSRALRCDASAADDDVLRGSSHVGCYSSTLVCLSVFGRIVSSPSSAYVI
jgi:hypothetical protein